MTTACPACTPRSAFGKRMYQIGMTLFGPAEMGPYGPSAAPPPSRPRDHKGRLIKEPKGASTVASPNHGRRQRDRRIPARILASFRRVV